MRPFQPTRREDHSLRLTAVVMLAGFLLLLAGLWQVQVISAKHYKNSQQDQSSRTVRVPAMRGRILDRHGAPLADVQPSFNLGVYLEDLRSEFRFEFTNRIRPDFLAAHPGRTRLTPAQDAQLQRQARYAAVSNLLLRLEAVIQSPLSLSEERFNRHYMTARSLALPLATRLTPEQVALFSEQAAYFPEVELETAARRVYPHGTLAAHLLGHLKRDDGGVGEEEAEQDRPFRYRLQDYAGARGLEAAYEHVLRGVAGVKMVQINSMAYRHAERMVVEPEPGRDVFLTLDLSVQRAAERALSRLSTNQQGAAVAMDVRSGEILALASGPTFNPNFFIHAPTNWTEVYQGWLETQAEFNRAAYGTYEAGSTFKIVVALAGLEAGLLDPDEIFTSAGEYRLPGRSRAIRDTAGAGNFDLRSAFYKSSNPYFIHHGLRVGPGRLVALGRSFGLGERTGLSTGQESAGYFPDPANLRKKDGSRWMEGDTANLSIGHGELLVTPLQMAVLTAAVANGGKVLEPRIERAVMSLDSVVTAAKLPAMQPIVRRELGVHRRHLEMLVQAMADDVAHPAGTGRAARLEGFAICAKTGTAELPTDRKTWFVSFAPREDPRYAVVVEVTNGVSGGHTCAPMAREIYQALIRAEKEADGKGGA